VLCPQEQSLLRAQLELMYRCRIFEDLTRDLMLRGLIKGTSHLAQGQEAVAVGVASAMRGDDYTLCTYRGHQHVLCRGVRAEWMFAEMMGKKTGLMGGKGGSMHLGSAAHGVLGSFAIVGAHLPIALGAAWSAQSRASGQVTVCFFGDGATNIGAFHEALNLAVVWKLPVVFVCENNLYMEYSPIAAHTAVPRPAADRAAAYGLEAIEIDGNDVSVVHETALRAIGRARDGEGPSLIEALTYRHGGHSRTDPAKYRPAGELERWLERDPIKLCEARLGETGIGEQTLSQLRDDALAELREAALAAEQAAPADIGAALAGVWHGNGSAWRN